MTSEKFLVLPLIVLDGSSEKGSTFSFLSQIDRNLSNTQGRQNKNNYDLDEASLIVIIIIRKTGTCASAGDHFDMLSQGKDADIKVPRRALCTLWWLKLANNSKSLENSINYSKLFQTTIA